MKNGKERFEAVGKKSAAIVTLALLIGGSGALGLAAQGSAILVRPERQVATVQSKFYCNSKALTPEERVRHKQIEEIAALAWGDLKHVHSPSRVLRLQSRAADEGPSRGHTADSS